MIHSCLPDQTFGASMNIWSRERKSRDFCWEEEREKIVGVWESDWVLCCCSVPLLCCNPVFFFLFSFFFHWLLGSVIQIQEQKIGLLSDWRLLRSNSVISRILSWVVLFSSFCSVSI